LRLFSKSQKYNEVLISCTLHFGFNYEINYQLDAIEYLFALSSFSLTAPEDGRVSPKHFGLKELKANKYSIASSW